jgi:hypothetical protein
MDSTYAVLIKSAKSVNDPEIAIIVAARGMVERGATEKVIAENLQEAFVGNPRIAQIAKNAFKQWGKGKPKDEPSKNIRQKGRNVQRSRSVRKTSR